MTNNHDESKVLRGQPKNAGQFRSPGNLPPESTLPAPVPAPEYGRLDLAPDDVRPGDVVYYVDGTRAGIATGVEGYDNPGERVVRLVHGVGLFFEDGATVPVERTEQAPQPGGEYWSTLEALYHPATTVEQLSKASDNWEDEDFANAIARHPNSTGDVLDVVAKNRDCAVRENVVQHPNALTETVAAIRDQALLAAYDDDLKPRPFATRDARLAVQAHSVLESRVPADADDIEHALRVDSGANASIRGQLLRAYLSKNRDERYPALLERHADRIKPALLRVLRKPAA